VRGTKIVFLYLSEGRGQTFQPDDRCTPEFCVRGHFWRHIKGVKGSERPLRGGLLSGHTDYCGGLRQKRMLVLSFAQDHERAPSLSKRVISQSTKSEMTLFSSIKYTLLAMCEKDNANVNLDRVAKFQCPIHRS